MSAYFYTELGAVGILVIIAVLVVLFEDKRK